MKISYLILHQPHQPVFSSEAFRSLVKISSRKVEKCRCVVGSKRDPSKNTALETAPKTKVKRWGCGNRGVGEKIGGLENLGSFVKNLKIGVGRWVPRFGPATGDADWLAGPPPPPHGPIFHPRHPNNTSPCPTTSPTEIFAEFKSQTKWGQARYIKESR